MTKRLFCFAVPVCIILLVIAGLNVSNQAINSLTMEERAPVFACNLVGQELSVYILGKNYVYSGENISRKINSVSNYSISFYSMTRDHLYRIEHLYQVIFRGNWDDYF